MKNFKNFINKYQKTIKYSLFFIFLCINFYFTLCHEPWRDEIHAWLMAKNLSIPDLITVSRFDGHPILWHLMLMPFAKLNFPIITLQIISFLIVSISAYVFVFHTKVNNICKFIILFTCPFIYIYSAIARNYCLILLLLVLIGALYDKRYEKPILYSILICFLIHTHTLAWGLVAGLTITFHMVEIIKYLKNKDKNIKIKEIILGFSLIVFNTILVVLELVGYSNPDVFLVIYKKTVEVVTMFSISTIIFAILTFLYAKNNKKELFIIVCGFIFQAIIYLSIYGAILDARYLLACVLWLFFIILISSTNSSKKIINIFSIAYIVINICLGYIPTLFNLVNRDISYPYSGAIEMSEYINENLPNEDTILTDTSIITQTLVPYLKNAQLYDIYYEDYFNNLKTYSDTKEYQKNINLNNYKGKYLLTTPKLKLNCPIVFRTNSALSSEDYVLYYINEE